VRVKVVGLIHRSLGVFLARLSTIKRQGQNTLIGMAPGMDTTIKEKKKLRLLEQRGVINEQAEALSIADFKTTRSPHPYGQFNDWGSTKACIWVSTGDN
jgi:hypothetical protein